MTKVVRSVVLLVVCGVAFGIAGLDSAVGQDKKGKDKDKGKTPPAAAATFEVYKDKGGKFRFRLKDGEGKQLAMAIRGYETKAEMMKLIDTIKLDAARAKVIEETAK